MHKIKIRLPASLSNFGTATSGLGLALALYTHVEVNPRADKQVHVEAEGEGAEAYPLMADHPVILSMKQAFEHLGREPIGVTVRIKNEIPLKSGLGAEAAFLAAGIVATNNILGGVLKREQVLELAGRLSPEAPQALAALSGGLSACLSLSETVLYRSIPLSPLKLVLAVPQISAYQAQPISEQRPHDLQALPFLLKAFADADLALLAQLFNLSAIPEALSQQIKGFQQITDLARSMGVTAITTSRSYPTLIFLTPKNPNTLADALKGAFKKAESPAKIYVLSPDTQGLVLSVLQSSP